MSATLMIMVGGKVRTRVDITEADPRTVARALMEAGPELARHGHVAIAVEKNGVTHIIETRRMPCQK